jgi:cell division protein FtsZ
MDVKKVLQQAGPSVMGSADAEGDDRAIKAIQEALNSPLLNDSDILGAKRILLTISSSSEYEATLEEQTIISNYIVEKIGEEARLFKIGAIFDDTLGPKMRVTIIAAGFETVSLTGTLPVVVATPTQDAGTSAELVPDGFEQPLPEKAVPVDLVIDDVEVSTPTFTHGGPTTLPTAGSFANGLSGVGYGSQNGISLNPTRQEDPEEIRQLINDFLSNRFTERELEAPAFSRHRVVLHEMPLLPDHEIIRTRLFD